MLDLMRRNASSWVIKTILGFIALTFIWWGVGSFTGEQADTVATVGKRRITASELEQAVSTLEKTYRDVYGAAFTRDMASALDLRGQALETLVQKEILLAEASRMGLEASDAEVRRDISTNPAFQANGAFSEERYRSILDYNRMSTGAYEASKRTEITLRKVEGVITAAARVTEREARELFEMTRRRVRLAVAAFDPEKAKGVAEPTEGDIAARYAETKEKYRTPARVKLVAARFTAEGFGAAGAPPTEAEIKAFHDENSDRFRTQEEREVTRAFFAAAGDNAAALSKAAELSTRPPAGKDDFVAAARKAGAAVSSSTLSRKSENDEAEKAVFAAGAGGLAGPVKVEGGVALYRVDRIRFPEAIPYDQVRGKVEQALRRERGRDQAVIAVYKAREAAEKGGSLKGALPPHVAVVETGWVGEADPGELPPAVVQEALTLPAGAVGPVKSVGDVHYLYQVAAKEDSKVPPLQEVRERIATELRADRRKAAARAEAAKLLASAKTAAELESGAKAAGASVTVTAPVSVSSGKLPPPLDEAPAIREEILRMNARNPVLARPVEAKGRSLAVALVSEEIPGEEEWKTEAAAFRKKAEARKKEEILSAFIAERRKAMKVTMNKDAAK
jgi:peptidyl-prolyl cis-trans isomerase D